MTYYFSDKSREKLDNVHLDLVRVANRAIEISEVDFAITEGIRTIERQAELMMAGASWTMKSRHLPIEVEGLGKIGHAIDVVAIVGGKISWAWSLYYKIADAMKQAAHELEIDLEWGGDWEQKDGPHFQLSWKEYPDGSNADTEDGVRLS